jgi:hypothetical protein
MSELYEFPPPRPEFKKKWIRQPDEPMTEDEAEAELLWARVWRGVELQKAMESILRVDGVLRFIPELIRSTWRAFRSRDDVQP